MANIEEELARLNLGERGDVEEELEALARLGLEERDLDSPGSRRRLSSPYICACDEEFESLNALYEHRETKPCNALLGTQTRVSFLNNMWSLDGASDPNGGCPPAVRTPRHHPSHGEVFLVPFPIVIKVIDEIQQCDRLLSFEMGGSSVGLEAFRAIAKHLAAHKAHLER